MQSRVNVDPPQANTRSSFTRQTRWIIASPEQLNDDAVPWSEICGCECIARLLSRKGFASADEVQAFLKPRLKMLSDPFLLPNMEAAVTRIVAAIDRRERVVLFGDYDVDGVTSLALLAEILRAYGATPDLFLPLRMEEGYGLSRESVERCVDQYRPAASHRARLRDLVGGGDCRSSQSRCRRDCRRSSRTEIGVAGLRGDRKSENRSDIARFIICAPRELFSNSVTRLLKTRPIEFDLKSRLDLVALGTVADIVPLVR